MSQCVNCKNSINDVETKQFRRTDPWNRNGYQIVSERICPVCGNRNEEIQYGDSRRAMNFKQEKRPALQCGSNEHFTKNNSYSL